MGIRIKKLKLDRVICNNASSQEANYVFLKLLKQNECFLEAP
jgi:hypothetical protein